MLFKNKLFGCMKVQNFLDSSVPMQLNFLENTKCKYKVVIKTLDENEDLRTPKSISILVEATSEATVIPKSLKIFKSCGQNETLHEDPWQLRILVLRKNKSLSVQGPM